MTKFEEKLEKLPIKNIEHPIGDTKYYKAVHVKTLIAQADEEFQELKEQNENQAESILLMLDEIKSLKSQLQQQALPVVPDFIGKLINTFGTPEDGKHINYSASYLEIQKELDWIDNHQKTWLTALLFGYAVEKPQLFYIALPNSTAVLQKDGELNSFADTVYKRYLIENAMTEQEIKSIDERYWQFAVPVEEEK